MAIRERISRQIVDKLSTLFKQLENRSIVKIANYLNPSLINFLDVEERDDALQKLVHSLSSEGTINQEETFFKAILEREKIVSTGIGMGVAIPHAKLKEYNDFFIAIGIQKKEGIEWNALDKAPVKIIFMIGGPENRQTEYLQILSCLTHIIKDEGIRKKIIHSNQPEDIMQLLKDF